MNDAEFGVELRRLRELGRLTQEQLAEKAGLSANAVSALERGERRFPYPRTVRALAVALGLDDDGLRRLRAFVPRRGSAPEKETVPRQLPAVPRHFTGRADDLDRLNALLPLPGTENRAVVISAIDGTAGVGKTTLAIVWAHQVRELFPDGQLYVNLRGYDPGPPAEPGEVLDGFLRALNVPITKIPPAVVERAALFRSVVDGRRVLVLLDNAGSAEQVRPLLPGSASCLVVVTSRASLTGLAVTAGAVRINLDRLPVADSVALLRAVIGPARADREPDAVVALVRLCARLPVALQLAGQRAAARPHLPLTDVAAELADETLRLLSLGTDECTAVRPVFSWSYRALPDREASLFRLLGVHPGPDIGPAAAAALAGVGPAEARCLLDGLADAHLVEHVGRDRFAPHDLLRAYAREQVVVDRETALRRLLGHYVHTAAAADHLLHPGRHRAVATGPPPDHPHPLATFDEALTWCETERAGLLAAVGAAAEAGLDTLAWQLVNNLWSFCYLRKHWSDWIAANQTGLAAARRSGDLNGQARMLNALAAAYVGVRRSEEAVEHFQRALPLFRTTGDRWGEGSVLVNLGHAHLGLRRYDTALEHSAQALAVVGEIGNPYLEGIALGNLGEAYLGLRWYDDALHNFLRVLDLCRQIGHRHGEGTTLIHLGEACLGLRRDGEAHDYLTQALELSRDTADRHGEGHAMMHLGHLHTARGRPDLAHQHWKAALAILDDLGDPAADQLRQRLQPRLP